LIQCVNLDIGNFFTDHCSALIGQGNRGEGGWRERGREQGSQSGVNTTIRVVTVASLFGRGVREKNYRNKLVTAM